MRHSSLIAVAAAVVGMLLMFNVARADDMGSMDMGGMTHQMMPEEGENAASMDQMMSSEHMEHDPMMAAHMGYTDLRPKNAADQKRADEMLCDAAKGVGEIQGLQSRRSRGLQTVAS